MKTKLLIAALFLSVGAYAQTPSATPTPLETTRMKPEMHRKAMTPEQRAEFKAEHKAKMAAMTPADRKAAKADMKSKHEARLAKMTPEQREKFMARKHKHGGKRS